MNSGADTDTDTDLKPQKTYRDLSLSLGRIRETLRKKKKDEEEGLAQSREILESATRLDNAMPEEQEDGREKATGGFAGGLGMDLGT